MPLLPPPDEFIESPVDEHPDIDNDDKASASMINSAESFLCDLIFGSPDGGRGGTLSCRSQSTGPMRGNQSSVLVTHNAMVRQFIPWEMRGIATAPHGARHRLR